MAFFFQKKAPPESTKNRTTQQTTTEKGELESLRWLLMGKERADIRKLEERVTEFEHRGITSDQVGDLLPDSIVKRSQADDKLVRSLTPVVEDAIRESITQNRFRIADILFPSMGPAIRKSIAQALRAFGETNQPEHEQYRSLFSLKGLKWRWEAIRTGRNFDDVLLAHTLLYRVEHIVLIHKESGLLLQELHAPNVPNFEADLFSSMLTALRDFAKDSLGRKEALDVLKYEGFSIVTAEGPQAYIAAVVRGNPPESLSTLLLEALENIHFEQQLAFRAFSGDTDIFEPSKPYLENCLDASYVPSRQTVSPAKMVLVLKWGGVLLVIGTLLYVVARDTIRWNRFVQTMRETPGYMITEAEKDWFTASGFGRYWLRGIKDPLAEDVVHQNMNGIGLNSNRIDVDWTPFTSLEKPILIRRLEKRLIPPKRLELRLTHDLVLQPVGVANNEWIEKAKTIIPAFDGVNGIDTQFILSPEDYLNKNLIPELTQGRVFFDRGKSFLNPYMIGVMAAKIKEIFDVAAQNQLPYPTIVLEGRTDGPQTPANQTLSIQRAESVKKVFVEDYHIPAAYLAIVGYGSSRPVKPFYPGQDVDQANRSVVISVK
ncbi:MAG: OmpA family protein [Rhodothermia bacterium]|nr:OmpA family protein [Rhodothermia bacterium]